MMVLHKKKFSYIKRMKRKVKKPHVKKFVVAVPFAKCSNQVKFYCFLRIIFLLLIYVGEGGRGGGANLPLFLASSH